MKFLALTTALTALVAGANAHSSPSGASRINDPDFIKSLNNVEGSTWSAGINDNFGNSTYDEVRSWVAGTALGNTIENFLHETLPQEHYDSVDSGSIPTEFDSRTAFPGLLRPIRNQKACGSCWAFSAAEVLSDRFAIQTKNTNQPPLSPEDLVSCDHGDMGCSGGRLPTAWSYLTGTGIVTDSCFPYGAGSGQAPACATKCVDGSDFKKYKAKNSYAINGVENMQKEIMTNGPVQVAFTVYKSFMSYKSGVYTKHWWEILPEGGHAVKIIGWGEENGTPYWLVANSWGTTWGDEGFFKIKRGNNECGIEKEGPPYAGMPSL